MKYNLKRGSMRLWAVLSVLWVIFVAGFFFFDGPDRPERPQVIITEQESSGEMWIDVIGYSPEKADLEDLASFTREEWKAMSPEELKERKAETLEEAKRRIFNSYEKEKDNFLSSILGAALAAISVPLFVLLLGHIVAWVVRGFRIEKGA